MADAESADADRPSFTAFWKRVKQKEKSGREGDDQKKKKGKKASTSPSSTSELQAQDDEEDQPQDQDPGDSPTGASTKELDAKDKAQLRRAQVRKAQIQHRQRKANYVKQLELDVSELRDLITQAQQETSHIRKQNDDIRDLLRKTEPTPQFAYPQADSTYYSNPDSPGTRMGGLSELDTQEWLAGRQLSDLDLNPPHPLMPSTSNDAEMFGHINIDDITVSLGMNELLGTPCFTINTSSSGGSVQGYASPSHFEHPPLTPPLTPQQEQIVLNWILALENICWNHYQSTDFYSHVHNDSERSSNHALTATAILMNAAPTSIFADREIFASLNPAETQAPTFQWQANGFTMGSLWALAQVEIDPTEISPVQIWFDLAAKYPYELLFVDGLLTALLLELRPFIRCIEYGAAVNRQFYEDVIERVLGPPPAV